MFFANTAARGTRSHPDYSECFENDSTAPPPAAFRGSLHTSSRDAPPPAAACHDGRMHPALALAVLPLVSAPPWGWPVDPPHVIVRPYIAPPSPYGSGHRGIDIAAPSLDVRAPADGVVHFAGSVVDRPLLSVEHPGGVLSSYEPVVTTLEAGDSVARGEIIGTVVPGHCALPCLHFGVRVDGRYESPLAWLGGIDRAVLLPTRAENARAPAHGRESRIRSTLFAVGERSPLCMQRRCGAPRSFGSGNQPYPG